MTKKIFLLVVFLLVFVSISHAEICDVDRTKDVLRKNLYLYLESSSSPLTIGEVKDLLIFYIGIQPGSITVDCSTTGSTSTKVISAIIDDGDAASDIIPVCSDGTKYGKCSGTKPKYCYSGSLINKCNSCGCPSQNSCDSNNNCNPSGSIACFSSLDCGNNQFTGNYYCSGNYITRNYVNYTCTNPGTASSSCASSNNAVTLTYCDPSLNQACTNGSASCQAVADTTQPASAITSPANNAIVSGTISVTATASDNVAVAGVQFKLDGSNLGAEDTASPYSISWNTSTATNGQHTLTAIARDTSNNNANSSPIAVTVNNTAADTTPPIRSNPHVNTTLLNNTILPSGTASTPISLTTNENANCRYTLIAGTAYSSMPNTFSTTGATSHSTTISGLTSGTNYKHYIRCQDTAGNPNTDDYIINFSVTSALDTTAPIVWITSPLNGTNVSGLILVNANASDNVGVVGIQFKLDWTNLGSEDLTSPYSVSWNTSTATNGSHNLAAVARDAAGNNGTSSAVTVFKI